MGKERSRQNYRSRGEKRGLDRGRTKPRFLSIPRKKKAASKGGEGGLSGIVRALIEKITNGDTEVVLAHLEEGTPAKEKRANVTAP